MIHHKRKGTGTKYRRGRGIFDFIKPLFNTVKPLFGVAKSIATNPNTGSIVKDLVTVGSNTRDIVNSIRNKRNPITIPIQNIPMEIQNNVNDISSIINRINNIRLNSAHSSGSGFVYI